MRPPDWPERLRAHIVAAQAQPWCWGRHDCCTFASGVVRAMGGPDLWQGGMAEYDDEDGARACILSRGRDLEEALECVCHRAGLDQINPLHARRGDLLVCRDRALIGGVPLAAICDGRDAVSTTRRGLIRWPAHGRAGLGHRLGRTRRPTSRRLSPRDPPPIHGGSMQRLTP